jgi:kynurenine formamidase
VQVIDLSKPIRFNRDDPFFMRIRVKHKPHSASRLLVRLLGLPFSLFPKDFEGWADDSITRMGVHATTHIDAPWHYGPASDGQPAPTIDAIPLKKCLGPGVVFDMTHKADDDPITVADMQSALERTGAELDTTTIVLIRTGRDRYVGTREYWRRGTGMSAAATEWLLDRGVTVMGIDQWGWDLPSTMPLFCPPASAKPARREKRAKPNSSTLARGVAFSFSARTVSVWCAPGSD